MPIVISRNFPDRQEETPSVNRRTRRRLARVIRGTAKGTWWASKRAYTHRRGLAPIYAAVILAGVAAILHETPDGPETAATIGAVGAAGVYSWARVRKMSHRDLWARRDRVDAQKLMYAWSMWLTATMWLIIAAINGVTTVPSRTALVAGTVAFGSIWLWHHRIRGKGEDIALEQEQIWEEELACPNGPLRGAVMENLTVRGPDDFDFDVVLRRQQTKHLIQAAGDIASAYSMPTYAVVAEGARDDSNNRGHVTVAKRNPTSEVVEFDETWLGVDDDGTYLFHMYPDGQRGRLRLYERRSGVTHALHSGDNRTGKSEGMSVSCVQGVAAGLTVPVILDSQDGLSMPAWGGEDGLAPYKATGNEDNMDDVVDLWMGLNAVAGVRQRYMKLREWEPSAGRTVRGMGFYDPHMLPELPILDIYIPEGQRFLAVPGMAESFENAVATWAKLGMRLNLDTQYPSADKLGGSMALRTNLSQNIVCCRNNSKETGNMILSSHMPPPHEIPLTLVSGATTKGLAVVQSSAPGSMRPTIGRIVFQRDGWQWAARAVENLRELDDMSRTALEDTIRRRQEERVERARKATEAAAARAAQQDAGDSAPTPPSAAAAGIPNGSVRERALAFLAQHEYGRATTGAIAHAIDATTNAVSTALRRAANNNEVVDLGHSVWGDISTKHQYAEVQVGEAA
ncbi:hypothetical protein OOJ91_33980 [Micromonospora lupini]|uniref:hypothetical protein n=1 Tax=Micromonospora lupini TaxID=285679 RepID=UPI00225B158C|nr:hypothetical protein [Micromonospora lupini]MCX5070858.1 hypothetical protein [Micromonospora lupini]